MSPVETILTKLPEARKSGAGWSAQCPAHDDRRASLSISQSDDGAALIRCHAGCDTAEILSVLGLKWTDLFPPNNPGASSSRNGKPKKIGVAFPTAEDVIADLERKRGKVSSHWIYRDAQNNSVGFVLRWDKSDGKEILPVSLHADGWRNAAMPAPRPLYNLPDLPAATRVIVTEGEKAADAARSLGFMTTTSSVGSQAAAKTDWRPLAGKEIWILPDNDRPGRKYSDEVTGILSRLHPAPVVRIIQLPDLPQRGDIVDWIHAHGDAAEPDGLREELVCLAGTVDQWRPVEADALSYVPFPVDLLPEPIKGFVDAGARAIGCDPSFLALPLLVAISSAIGNTRRLELKRGWLVPAILWGAIVGESGTAKTPAFKVVMHAIRERQRCALDRHAEAMQQFEIDYARWEKEHLVWKRQKVPICDPPSKPTPPQAVRYVVSDTTVEALAPIQLANPRGLLLARDELAGWIGSFDRYAKGKAGADVAHWLSMFNAESIIVDRKTGTPRTIHVPQAAICVIGGIQPTILQRALSTEHRDSGLAARLLLAYPPQTTKRWTEADINPEMESALVVIFDGLYELHASVGDDGNARPALVRLSPEAKDVWKKYFNTHALEMATLTGDLAAAWSKLEEYAARLAMVVHFVRWAANDPALDDPDVVDVTSMEAGIALANWFKHEAIRVYAMLDETDQERDARRLIEWIVRKGGSTTVREAQMGCRWLREPGAAESALDALTKIGKGFWRDMPSSPKGGRPTRVFMLSTLSTSTEPRDPQRNSGFG